jgi:hypothetical protein
MVIRGSLTETMLPAHCGATFGYMTKIAPAECWSGGGGHGLDEHGVEALALGNRIRRISLKRARPSTCLETRVMGATAGVSLTTSFISPTNSVRLSSTARRLLSVVAVGRRAERREATILPESAYRQRRTATALTNLTARELTGRTDKWPIYQDFSASPHRWCYLPETEERCESGRIGLTANELTSNRGPGVQIPPSPLKAIAHKGC